jgi:hypothetical protein
MHQIDVAILTINLLPRSQLLNMLFPKGACSDTQGLKKKRPLLLIGRFGFPRHKKHMVGLFPFYKWPHILDSGL